MFRPRSDLGQCAQNIAALTTLVLCGTFFALSCPRSDCPSSRPAWIGSLLGIPWVLVMVLVCLPAHVEGLAFATAALSHVCVAFVALRLFGRKSIRFGAALALVAGCGTWLYFAAGTGSMDAVVEVVLTLCFGFNAVLLSAWPPQLSAANITTSVGSIAWGLVWVAAVLVNRRFPGLAVSPEIWNLPKYFVAAGMVLRLLDEEIRSREVASEQYRLLFAGNPHPMWIFDPETFAILEVNDSAVSHYGYSRANFQSMTLRDIFLTSDDPDALKDLRSPEPQTLAGPWLHRRSDGTEFQVDIATHPVEREDRRATFALMHDVTEPQRLHAQLIRQAHHDALTGLPNRTLFEQNLEEVLARAAEECRRAAVFCIDLDRFKQINDTFGHSAGDRCLRELTERITSRVQGIGTLARTGGDEFMLILGDLEQPEAAEHLASLLLHDLKNAVKVDAGEVELSVSVGIAVYPDDGIDSAQLWRDADAAMYRAKRAGGCQAVRVSREISRVASEANDIEVSLRRALKTGDFVLHYQPQMTAGGELHSLEALVRFRDPVLSSVSAERVVGIAEESGLIVPLGEWVLEEVCRQSRMWINEGLRPICIAVNVSPLQLTRSNFSLKVASALERYQLRPELIECEVTESTMMPDRGDAPDQIAMLARMGVHFSVDDFGTGYSSLGRLHQLPVKALKIDSSFTKLIAGRKGTYPTVRAIIALAHTFGMQVVAEGVETEEQLSILRALRCDRMQGYLFSRPLPAEKLRAFMNMDRDRVLQEKSA